MKRAALISAVLVLTAYGCAGESSTSDAPADHTVSQHGVMHGSGLEDPLTSCVSCHGETLQGDKGPSCTSCHGMRW